MVSTIQTVDKETQRLEKLSMKLCELDSGLNKIHVWSVESAPAVIERIQRDQSNPEIKARGIEEVQGELQKRRDSLERLTQDLHSFEKGKLIIPGVFYVRNAHIHHSYVNFFIVINFRE